MKLYANKEYLIIAIVWMLIYAMAPLYIWYADTLNGFEFNAGRLYGMWMTTTMFLLLYVVHHFILVPKFFITKRYAVYTVSIVLVYDFVCIKTDTSYSETFRTQGTNAHEA